MSSTATSDLTQPSSTGTKSKKHRKKKGTGKPKVNGSATKLNDAPNEEEAEIEEFETEEAGTPVDSVQSHVEPLENGSRTSVTNGGSPSPPNVPQSEPELGEDREDSESLDDLTGNRSRGATQTNRPQGEEAPFAEHEDTQTRLDALARDRTALRDEVTQLRRSLEEIQGKHQAELSSIREKLEDTQGEKEQAEAQYRNLFGKVNSIKSQLGERLKADAEDLSQARSRIEELEEQNSTLQEQNEARAAEVAKLAEEGEQRSKELSSLRNRTNLSQQNWNKEREDLMQREAFTKEEFEAARQAMQDWEVLAMEERSIREALGEKVADLEEQVSSQREAYEKAASDRDSQSLTVDGLQRALQEIQDARKRELRELVENSQAQIESLRKQLQEVETRAAEAESALDSAKKEIERALPFEKEVKEKNLLIGKLRHEAVILNDHLTKALRYLKKGKPEDNIDKQLVTNHFLHFLALERADPKKFQVLQIIAALLGWTEAQREQAGLARPGASNPNLRTPISPWHRTPSTAALSTDSFPESGRKESLAELWSEFLEQEAQEGTKSSRSTSISSTPKPS
ncbi:hypothetical protein MMC24_004773 [Lignoscripta atroalba]|nr:hypothetical protein [Lignoscripta atroalba]